MTIQARNLVVVAVLILVVIGLALLSNEIDDWQVRKFNRVTGAGHVQAAAEAMYNQDPYEARHHLNAVKDSLNK